MFRTGEVPFGGFEFFSGMSAKIGVEFGEGIEEGVDILIRALVDNIDVDSHHRRTLEHS